MDVSAEYFREMCGNLVMELFNCSRLTLRNCKNPTRRIEAPKFATPACSNCPTNGAATYPVLGGDEGNTRHIGVGPGGIELAERVRPEGIDVGTS